MKNNSYSIILLYDRWQLQVLFAIIFHQESYKSGNFGISWFWSKTIRFMQNEKCEKPGPFRGIATGVSCTWDGWSHEVLGPSPQGAASDKFRPISMINHQKWDFYFFNVIDEELRKKNDDFWRNLQIWTPVDSYSSHPDTSARDLLRGFCKKYGNAANAPVSEGKHV